MTEERLKEELSGKPRSVSFYELYYFTNVWDHFLITVALFMAFLHSFVYPIGILAYGELTAMFIDRNLLYGTSTPTYLLQFFGGGKILTNASHEENMGELLNDSIAFGMVSIMDMILMIVSGTLYIDIFNRVALKVVTRMQRKLFEVTIRQDIGWHDVAHDQNFAVYITDNLEKIRNGIGENVGHFFQFVCDIILCVTISFSYGWKLSLAIFFYIPITIYTNVVVSKYQSKLTTLEQDSYASASSVAEETISGIRTVAAFEGEKVESQRYDDRLLPACKAGKMKSAIAGLSESILNVILSLCVTGAYWYGTDLVLEDRYKDPSEQEYTPIVLMTITGSIGIIANHISRTAPFLETFAIARGSAVAIFNMMEATSKIDPLSKKGDIPKVSLRGKIEFQDVFFRYPSREETIVLRGFNLSVREGQTVALVGSSGSGKSTCVQLIQRFYDPIFGHVFIDDEDVKKYNIAWLRSNIAVVGQEPVLFQGSIGINIRHGKPCATQKEVEDAAKAAGAHDFIIGLPDSYNTLISEKGVQLSGGQRQRIAIARALIQNPKILLLDEATSALDYHSEKMVQAALNEASRGRTTLVVSHRLSAICHADRIVFIDNGRVIEEGTHNELMKLGGKYHEMVVAHQYNDDTQQLADEWRNELTLQQPLKFLHEVEEKVPNGLHPQFNAKESTNQTISSILENNNNSDCENVVEIKYTKTFFRLLRWAKPEWGFLILGTICSGIYGFTEPIMPVIYAKLYSSLTDADNAEAIRHTGVLSLINIGVGLTAGLSCFIQAYFINLTAVWLTTRMRSETFKSIIRQDMAWFDEKENSIGALSARLAGDASRVQGAIGFPFSDVVRTITAYIFCISVSFYYSWQLCLISFSSLPLLMGCVAINNLVFKKSAVREKEILEEMCSIATEAITHIRTVAALRRESSLMIEYDNEVIRYELQMKSRLRYHGFLSSSAGTMVYMAYAGTLAYGGVLCADGRVQIEDIFKIATIMLYGFLILAQSLISVHVFNAALISANRLYYIIDRQPNIESPAIKENHRNLSKQNDVIMSPKSKPNPTQGVNYRDIHFRYPTRRDQKVLNGFNLEVLHGKTIALVGPSGSGKSTCVQLLQRYYDPDSGKILIDQEDIHQNMELPTLRRRLGIVSQEPCLFEKTIAENIAYGDTSRVVPLPQIVEAAKMANAHDFITALPSGYDTCLGAKGTQLSGGQKQRIAIARALVRNPKILLLDEATSALDLQSERIVQSALDEACCGRTCLVIAHRLSTVQKADLICVLQNGHIAERGTHSQLLAKNGLYAKLYRSQSQT